MAVDPEAVRAAVVELRARTPVRRSDRLISQDIHPGLQALTERLVHEHGLDAVVEGLAPHRADRNVAEVLFFLFWSNLFWDDGRDMLTVFSEDEIIEAALQHLSAFRDGSTGTIDERELPGWGWSAIWQHYYEGPDHPDHLTDDQHFSLLLELIERVPMDDSVLWMIGDGPLSHARANPEYRRRIEVLMETNPKISRAIRLDEVDYPYGTP